MKKETRISIASDYAVLNCSNGLQFYFGYERTLPAKNEDESGEWCFELSYPTDKKPILIPQSELGVDDGSEMSEFLLAGIGKLIDRRKLVAYA